MNDDLLRWLQAWYKEQADGDWEHSYGIVLKTLDNPGWTVTIDLQGTKYEQLNSSEHDVRRTEDDWVVYRVREGRLEGFCGPENLIELLESLRRMLASPTDG